MIASDFSRDDCLLGKKRVSYAKLEREYRCALCGGRPVTAFVLVEPKAGVWLINCGRCQGHDFIHEYEYERQQHDAAEVLDGLPQELAALLMKGEASAT